MGKTFDEIPQELMPWLAAQKLFFVATAPLAETGHVNCSPKGLDSFRVLSPTSCCYLDLTGSGAETIAHLRENGRITLMFSAFDGPPQIVRIYGRGLVHRKGTEQFESLSSQFADHVAARSIITIAIDRVSTSCGYAVPKFDFVGERDTLTRYSEAKGPDGIREYQQEKNLASIDGLPAL